MTDFNIAKREGIALFGALLLAAGVKIWLLMSQAVPFNSDEAVVALMARHILQGERPVFFYGQAYMGSLDAWLVAATYSIFGQGVLPVRIVQIGLYLAYLLSLWLVARALFTKRRVATLAVVVAAVPTVLVTTYTTASLGGYGEIIVLGNLILWGGYRVSWGGWRASRLAWLFLGFLSGVAFWTSGLSLVYILPVGLVILLRFRFSQVWLAALGLIGFGVGSSAWWYHNLVEGWAALKVLIEASPASTSPLEHLVSLLVLGIPGIFGLRFPWSPTFSPLPLLFIGLLVYLAAAAYLGWSLKNDRALFAPGAVTLLGLFVLLYILVYTGSRYGVDGSGRYLLPLNLLVVLSAGVLLNAVWRRRPAWAGALLLLLLFINGAEIWRASRSDEKITTQFDPITRFDNRYDSELINFLRQNAEMRGYSNYWVSYRLAFLSNEELIYAPRLPYKADLSYAPGDDRYPQYSDMVLDSSKVALITTLHPQLDQELRRRLSARQVNFDEQWIGPYHVFYNLSRKVLPAELDLGILPP